MGGACSEAAAVGRKLVLILKTTTAVRDKHAKNTRQHIPQVEREVCSVLLSCYLVVIVC